MEDNFYRRSCGRSANLGGGKATGSCERAAIKAVFLLLLSAVCLRATTLTGTLKNPDGTGANGTLIFSLAQQAALSSTVPCGGPAEIVPSYQVRIQVVSGVMQSPPAIYGNDCLLPQGTYYNVQLNDSNGNILFTDRWVIQGTSIDIGTIVSVVISGTTQTLGGVGVVQTAPTNSQTVAQPMGTVLSINYLTASGTFTLPSGTVCNASGCGALTFSSGVIFNGGLQTLIGTNSLVAIGSGGQLINRTWSGFDATCGGVQDGFQGVRTDTHALQMCIGGLTYQVVLTTP